jgi:hypothetical protein
VVSLGASQHGGSETLTAYKGGKRPSLKNVRNLAAWDVNYRNRLLGLA